MKHLFILLLFLNSYLAFSANRYWVAGSSSNWNNTANWSTTSGGTGGSAVPVAADAVIFDGGGVGDCAIDLNASVTTIAINSGYTGTVTQNAGITIATSSTFTIAAGTFTGGNSDIDINSTFTISGGTFTSTTGNFYLNGAWTHTAGGTFNHNNGSIISDASADRTWNFITSETFYNLNINHTGNTYDLFVSAGDNLIVTNTLLLTNGILTQNDAAAKLTAQANVTIASTWDGGTCDIEFTGSVAVQDFDLTGATALHTSPITINKASGKVRLLSALTAAGLVTITSGELDLNTYTFTSSGGFTQTGGIFTSGAATMDFNTSDFTLSGGTFNATTGNWNLDGAFTHTAGGTFNLNNCNLICDFTADRTWNFATSETFYNLTINNTANTYDLFVSAGDNLIVTNTLLLTNGILTQNDAAAKLTAQANVTIASTWDGGTCDIEFTGSVAVQDFDLTGATALHTSPITINKASGKVRLLSALTAAGLVTITSGELDLNTYTLTSSGGFTQTGGIFTSGAATMDFNTSDFTLSGGTFNATTGTWYLDGTFTHTAGGTFNLNNCNLICDFTADRTWNFATSETFYNLTINNTASTYDLFISAGDNLIVTNTLLLTNGILTQNDAAAKLTAQANVTIASTWDGGTCDIEFTGSVAVQDFDLTGAAALHTGDITINKASGKVRLLSALTAAGLVTVTSGELDLNTYTLTSSGGFTQTGGIFTSGAATMDFNTSNFTLSGGTFNATTGTWYLDGTFTHTAGGTFNLNNCNLICDFTADRTWNFATSETFYNLTINNTASTYDLFISAGDNLIVTNTLLLTNGILTQNDAAAKLTAQANVTIASTWDGGTCDIEFTGSVAVQDFDLTGAAALHTGDITINKASGKVRLLSALTAAGLVTVTSGELDLNTYTLTSSGGFTQTGGIFTSGAATMDFNTSNFTLSGGTFNATSSIWNIDGAWTHTAGGTFNHNNGTIIFDGSADRTWNFANYESFYNLTINSTADAYDLIISASDTIKTNGIINFINGTYTLSASSFVKIIGGIKMESTWDGSLPDLSYTGTGNQTLDFTGAEAKLTSNLTINKSSGSVQLLSNIQMGTAKTLTLTAGVLDLNSKKLIITNSATNAIARTNGYIKSESTDMSGKVLWFINTTTGAHVIPFGDPNGVYIPFTLNMTAGDCDTMKVATYYTANCATKPPTVSYLHTNAAADVAYRFWQIDKTGATGTFDMTFSYADQDIPTDGESNLQAQRWNGTSWAAAIAGQTLTTGSNTVLVPGVTSFSPWALARSTNPLPVELISFSAEYSNKQVNIKWETASEINNDYFVVEKSINGIDYVEVDKYDIAENDANSNVPKSYMVIDANPYTGISYYRLKQVDLNGVYEIFAPVVVSCDVSTSFDINSVVSDANAKSIKIVYGCDTIENVRMLVYNQSGQAVFEKQFKSTQGSNMAEFRYSNLPNGIYFINLINSKQSVNTKVYLE